MSWTSQEGNGLHRKAGEYLIHGSGVGLIMCNEIFSTLVSGATEPNVDIPRKIN